MTEAMTKRAATLPFVLAGVLAAGCGSSGPGESSSGAPRLAGTEVHSQPAAAGAVPEVMFPVVPGPAGERVQKPFKGETDSEANETGARPLHPCRILTGAEVARLTHVSVLHTTEAPNGPTCIYRVAAKPAQYGFAVQSLAFSVAAARVPRHRLTAIAGHRAYCRTLGQSTLFVDLPAGRVMSVQAPCRTAARLATRALRALPVSG
jgi:hypothetical protein